MTDTTTCAASGMTKLDRMKLRMRAEAAISGPWEVRDGHRVSVVLPCPPVEDCGYDSVCVALTYPDRRFDHKANAAFIAAASPTAVLALLDELEALRSALAGSGTSEEARTDAGGKL